MQYQGRVLSKEELKKIEEEFSIAKKKFEARRQDQDIIVIDGIIFTSAVIVGWVSALVYFPNGLSMRWQGKVKGIIGGLTWDLLVGTAEGAGPFLEQYKTIKLASLHRWIGGIYATWSNSVNDTGAAMGGLGVGFGAEVFTGTGNWDYP